MNKFEGFYPDYFYKKVSDIPEGFFKDNKIRFAILDIDNTLVPYTVKTPDESALAFLERLKREGVEFCFLSNNNGKRVEIFNENIGAKWISNAKKPLLSGFKKAMRIMNATPDETILIGDQVFTDIWCARRAGAKAMLVLPIEDKETLFFKFKRALERVVLKDYKGE